MRVAAKLDKDSIAATRTQVNAYSVSQGCVRGKGKLSRSLHCRAEGQQHTTCNLPNVSEFELVCTARSVQLPGAFQVPVRGENRQWAPIRRPRLQRMWEYAIYQHPHFWRNVQGGYLDERYPERSFQEGETLA
jgi:hypothetical protein